MVLLGSDHWFHPAEAILCCDFLYHEGSENRPERVTDSRK